MEGVEGLNLDDWGGKKAYPLRGLGEMVGGRVKGREKYTVLYCSV